MSHVLLRGVPYVSSDQFSSKSWKNKCEKLELGAESFRYLEKISDLNWFWNQLVALCASAIPKNFNLLVLTAGHEV